MRLTKQLATYIAVISLIGCAGLPKPPEGNLYLHFGNEALCSEMKIGGGACPPLPIEKTQNFIMLEPQTWEALNNYIDELIRLARGDSNGFLSRKMNKEDKALLEVLLKIKHRMLAVDESFKKQKRR